MRKVIVLVMLLAAAAAQAVDKLDAGGLSCATSTEVSRKTISDGFDDRERGTATILGLMITAWMNGYGVARGMKPYTQQYHDWVSGYCLMNPSKTVRDGVREYFNKGGK